MPYKRLIAVDFDGVLHAYTTPWSDAATISDGPTPGAMRFLRDLAEDQRFDVVVVSSRCSNPLAVERIEAWLQKHLMAEFGEHDGHEIFSSGLRVMRSDEGKLPAFLTLDDRANQFTGTWPDLDQLAVFKPWNKRPAAKVESAAISAPDVEPTQSFTLTRDELQNVVRQAYAAGNEAKLMQSNWGRAEGSRELVASVLARFERSPA